ncbi:hypothetical protein FIBSPDRAFT_901151 [Athelia psychrophila]|uniref:Uncharacterized protein n=1 Tax=Athelia psychrophila TaxID=1759441 RepID=A0A165XIN1_9AGAM|nr:hypothetical protein FIBSPDRAFT_901151 [Fibularhizoctonia sp. CBS 109695]
MKNVDTPVHRLPEELLGEILTLSVIASWKETRGPVALSVCPRWRMVALSTPRVWSNISFLSPNHTQAEFKRAETWLARSGQSPLTIHVGHHVERAMELLVPFSARWISVVFLADPSRAPNLPMIKGELPLLESLKLINPGYDPTSTFKVFNTAPRLRHLTYFEYCNIHEVLVPWDKLASCTVTTFRSLADAISLLSNAPNLTDLTIHIQSHGVARHSPHPAIRHPRLASLHLHAPFHGAQFLNILELPSLRDLRIYPSFDTTWQPASVAALLSRSKCNLNRLLIHMGAASAHQLSQLLHMSPSLEHLTLEFDRGYRWFSALKILEPEHGLVPALRTLCLDFKGDFDFAELALMVEARWWGVYGYCSGSDISLKSVRARCYCDGPFLKVDPLSIERLKALHWEGLDIGFVVGQELRQEGEPFL